MIIAILNQKGGVGKTTTAVTIAAGLARMAIRTLLMDLDGQSNCSDALGLESAPDLHELLINNRPLKDLAAEARENLWLVRSERESTRETETSIQVTAFGYNRLAKALKTYPYDAVILDCAPSADGLHFSALVASDYVLIPAEMAQLSIKGIYEVQETLNLVHEETRSNCEILGIIPTKYDRTHSEHRKQLENLAAAYPALVWPPIPVDAKCEIAHRKGQTLWEYAPRTRALTGWKEGQTTYGGYIQVLDKILEIVR